MNKQHNMSLRDVKLTTELVQNLTRYYVKRKSREILSSTDKLHRGILTTAAVEH